MLNSLHSFRVHVKLFYRIVSYRIAEADNVDGWGTTAKEIWGKATSFVLKRKSFDIFYHIQGC